MDLLSRYKGHPKVLKIDRDRIDKALEEFEAELNKVSGPIVERNESTTRIVDPANGNPSDKRAQQVLPKE